MMKETFSFPYFKKTYAIVGKIYDGKQWFFVHERQGVGFAVMMINAYSNLFFYILVKMN